MESIEHLRKLVTYAGREILDADHPLTVEAVGGTEYRVFEVSRGPSYVVKPADQRPASGQAYQGYRARGGYRGLKGLVTHG